MDILLLVSLLFPLFPHVSELNDCPASNCGDASFPIRFPFWLVPNQPENCGFPSFNVDCNSHGLKTLKLPKPRDFFVRGISYVTQEIQLFKPENCLPRKLLTLNLSGSPFVAPVHQNYTFLSKSRFTPTDCLSNSTTWVLATPSTSLMDSMSTTCRIVATLAVLVSGQVQTGMDSQPTLTRIFVRLGISLLAVLEMWKVAFVDFSATPPKMPNCRTGLMLHSEGPPLLTATTSPTVENCLGQTTIESYQMLVLGESRRLPGHNDTTCAICFSEYLTKETVRCTPECKNCFHADCVDGWLKLNSSCPGCRNNPSPSQANSTPPAHVKCLQSNM